MDSVCDIIRHRQDWWSGKVGDKWEHLIWNIICSSHSNCHVFIVAHSKGLISCRPEVEKSLKWFQLSGFFWTLYMYSATPRFVLPHRMWSRKRSEFFIQAVKAKMRQNGNWTWSFETLSCLMKSVHFAFRFHSNKFVLRTSALFLWRKGAYLLQWCIKFSQF